MHTLPKKSKARIFAKIGTSITVDVTETHITLDSNDTEAVWLVNSNTLSPPPGYVAIRAWELPKLTKDGVWTPQA